MNSGRERSVFIKLIVYLCLPGNIQLLDYERYRQAIFSSIWQYHQREARHNVCCWVTSEVDQAQSIISNCQAISE